MNTFHVVNTKSIIDGTDEKGKPAKVMVFHYRLFVTDHKPSFDSGDYRIVMQRRKLKGWTKQNPIYYFQFTLSVIPRVPQSPWTNPSGKAEVWYKIAPDRQEVDSEGQEITVRPYKRTDDKPWTREECLRWLKFKLGDRAAEALYALENTPPEFASQVDLAA